MVDTARLRRPRAEPCQMSRGAFELYVVGTLRCLSVVWVPCTLCVRGLACHPAAAYAVL